MKYLLVLLVVGVGLWLLVGRSTNRGAQGPRRREPNPPAAAPPAAMRACARCGVHVPGEEALLDAHGRPFCSEAHRIAGPR